MKKWTVNRFLTALSLAILSLVLNSCRQTESEEKVGYVLQAPAAPFKQAPDQKTQPGEKKQLKLSGRTIKAGT